MHTTVRARSFTFQHSWQVSLLTLPPSPVVYSFSLSQYQRGTGELVVRDTLGHIVILDTLSGGHTTTVVLPSSVSPLYFEATMDDLWGDVTCMLTHSPGTVLSPSDFPNTVGSQWRYGRYDSVLNYRDTVDVRVVSVTRHANGGLAKVWAYSYHTPGYVDRVDSIYVVSNSDTVRSYWENEPEVPEQVRFAFPLLFL